MLRQLERRLGVGVCQKLCRRHYMDHNAQTTPQLFQQGVTSDANKEASPPQEVYVLPRPKYGGRHAITLVTGTTIIGQQGAKYMTSLLGTARVPVELESISVRNKTEYFTSVLRNRAAVHVDIQHDEVEKHNALEIATSLDLYVLLVKMRTFPGFNCRYPGLDIVLIGQNNMGDYSKLEYSPVPDVVENMRVVTEDSIARFLCFVFDYTRRAKRKRITIGHKMTETPKSDGMFVEIARAIQAASYPEIELITMEMDALVGALLLKPTQFDVICANDRYCSFLTTITSAVCGGANLFSAIEIGDHHAIFKPLQTKLSLTNFTMLSSYGIVSTCVDLLEYLGNKDCAEKLWQGMLRTMREDVKTISFGGKDSDEYIICNILNKLRCSAFDS